jgi:hypothetical protein
MALLPTGHIQQSDANFLLAVKESWRKYACAGEASTLGLVHHALAEIRFPYFTLPCEQYDPAHR